MIVRRLRHKYVRGEPITIENLVKNTMMMMMMMMIIIIIINFQDPEIHLIFWRAAIKSNLSHFPLISLITG